MSYSMILISTWSYNRDLNLESLHHTHNMITTSLIFHIYSRAFLAAILSCSAALASVGNCLHLAFPLSISLAFTLPLLLGNLNT